MILEEGSEERAELAGARRGSPSGATPRRCCGGCSLQPARTWSSSPACPSREGRCLQSKERRRSELPAEVPGACQLAGRGNIKPVWKSNSRIGTEGRKERNNGKMKPKLTRFVIENVQYRESSLPVWVARGTMHFLINPRGCSGVRWKSKATPTPEQLLQPPPAVREGLRQRWPLLSGCRFLATSSEACRCSVRN